MMTKTKQRTNTQNAALHLYFTHLSAELNENGLDIRKTLKSEFDIPWTPAAVKELMWKPVQRVMVGERSTTKLNKMEVSDVYETINRKMGELGVHVPFPSIETLNEGK